MSLFHCEILSDASSSGTKLALYFRKMGMKSIIVSGCMLLIGMVGFAQHATYSGYRSPLDIPLNLSGNFGEFRSNHFHSGIDIKTQGREGLSVYAIASGKVSRVKI